MLLLPPPPPPPKSYTSILPPLPRNVHYLVVGPDSHQFFAVIIYILYSKSVFPSFTPARSQLLTVEEESRSSCCAKRPLRSVILHQRSNFKMDPTIIFCIPQRKKQRSRRFCFPGWRPSRKYPALRSPLVPDGRCQERRHETVFPLEAL